VNNRYAGLSRLAVAAFGAWGRHFTWPPIRMRSGVCLPVCQVLAHVLRPGKQATGRTAWGWYHWAVGWTVLGLATINVFQVCGGACCLGFIRFPQHGLKTKHLPCSMREAHGS